MQDTPLQDASLQPVSKCTAGSLHCLGMGYVAQAASDLEVVTGRLLPEASGWILHSARSEGVTRARCLPEAGLQMHSRSSAACF